MYSGSNERHVFVCSVFCFSSWPSVLTEPFITGQTCSLRHIHRDVNSHGLLENTIHKLCLKAGPPRGKGRGSGHRSQCCIQRKGVCKINLQHDKKCPIGSRQLDQCVFVIWSRRAYAWMVVFVFTVCLIFFCVSHALKKKNAFKGNRESCLRYSSLLNSNPNIWKVLVILNISVS